MYAINHKGFGLLLILNLIIILGCRGYPSHKPPVHPNPNMDTQEKGKPYRESDFFADGHYMREPIPGTIAYGKLNTDEHFFTGMINNLPAFALPKKINLNEDFLARGQQIYNRTCAACHSPIGDGEGLVGKRLLVKPTSFHSDYMHNQPPGHYFNVITNGIRTMMPYNEMIKPADRWAVVAYLRSLQISQDINGEWIKRSSSWWKQK